MIQWIVVATARKKVVLHSNAPWMGSGYGTQAAMLAPRLMAMGYDTLISSFGGLIGAPLVWDGITVLPAGQDAYGSDTIPAHAFHAQADLVLTLMDVWALNGHAMQDVPLACWMPIDTKKLGDADVTFLEMSKAIPIAMSRHGEQALSSAGYQPLYVPHAVDTSVFSPRADRDELRESAGLTGKFVIGILAANKDAIRKCFFEQFEAFSVFRRDYCPNAVLLVHTLASNPGAPDLRRMAQECGIEDAVQFSNQYKTLMGLFRVPDMAMWLNTLDFLSNVSLGEGFGLTPLEAMSCGIPAVVNDCSAMTEVSAGVGWLVKNQHFWNPTHNARWSIPFIHDIVSNYKLAYETMSDENTAEKARHAARQRALSYDVNRVISEYWQPTLTEVLRRLEERKEAMHADDVPHDA